MRSILYLHLHDRAVLEFTLKNSAITIMIQHYVSSLQELYQQTASKRLPYRRGNILFRYGKITEEQFSQNVRGMG